MDDGPRGLSVALSARPVYQGGRCLVAEAGCGVVWQGSNSGEIVAILREHTQLLRSIDESLKAKMRL
jgi:hypothetical protein